MLEVHVAQLVRILLTIQVDTKIQMTLYYLFATNQVFAQVLEHIIVNLAAELLLLEHSFNGLVRIRNRCHIFRLSNSLQKVKKIKYLYFFKQLKKCQLTVFLGFGSTPLLSSLAFFLWSSFSFCSLSQSRLARNQSFAFVFISSLESNIESISSSSIPVRSKSSPTSKRNCNLK